MCYIAVEPDGLDCNITREYEEKDILGEIQFRSSDNDIDKIYVFTNKGWIILKKAVENLEGYGLMGKRVFIKDPNRQNKAFPEKVGKLLGMIISKKEKENGQKRTKS